MGELKPSAPPHIAFFVGALSFLSGIVYGSLGLPFFLAFLPALVVLFALWRMRAAPSLAVIATLLLMLGSAYYAWDDARYEARVAALPASGALEGVIDTDPKEASDYQSFEVRTSYGEVAVVTTPTPAYAYGDTLSLRGDVAVPSKSYELARHLVGSLKNPGIERLGEGSGNRAIAVLLSLKHRAGNAYRRYLFPEHAALLYGIMFGDNAGISKGFGTKLEESGLRFITAIDGLHMQVVMLILVSVFASFLSRRYAFFATFLFVVLFVALTGFTTSGIRAAFMAAVVVLARETGRRYAPHNSIAAAALLLALLNPKTLVFDVGFQLSFLAVVAIVYLLPVLRRLLRLSMAPGVLAWRESLLITVAVQLATAPVVIGEFQTFSLTSLLASVFVVWLLPFLMIGGFTLALSALVHPLGVAVGFLMGAVMQYVVFVIGTAARFALLFNPPLGFFGTVLYYGVLVTLMVRFAQQSGPEKVQSSA